MATDPILAAEQQHLEHARDALAKMRQDTRDWRQVTGGDHVSTQYLRQALYRRMQSLVDDPSVPLFFGRIDYRRSAGAELDEVCHIGRHHVSAGAGEDPLVVDWRANLAVPFYRARPSEPMGVVLRRRFGFQHGRLTAFEDESLLTSDDDTRAGDGQGASALLQAEIERPRTGPMRDIVATIQPDQDLLVRADLATSMAIQGAPGTGKTAVGLHRAAFLLYNHRTQLARQGILVLGPNDSFLGHIAEVLPALGEIDALQETITSLTSTATGVAVRGRDTPGAARLKGDARMATVLARAVWTQVGRASEPLAVPLGARVWRVPPPLLDQCTQALVSAGMGYESGRELLGQRLAHQVLLRMEASGEITDDRTQKQVARSAPVKAMVKQLWPALRAPAVVHRLFTDAQHLASCADGVLDAQEQQVLLDCRTTRSPGSTRWTEADLVLMDEVENQLRRTPSLGHVIIDEAQDLSAMQLRAAGRRASTGSVTLLGDLAQATTPWGATSWARALADLGQTDGVVHELVEGFRVPEAVIDFAARLLPRIAPDLRPPTSIRRGSGSLELQQVDDLDQAVAGAVGRLLDREGSIGVIVPDALAHQVVAVITSVEPSVHLLGEDHHGDDQPGDEDDPVGATFHRLEVVPATLVKGLEFDHVLVVEPSRIAAAEVDEVTGLRRVYVCLTRAVTSAIVVHHDPLPALLSGAAG